MTISDSFNDSEPDTRSSYVLSSWSTLNKADWEGFQTYIWCCNLCCCSSASVKSLVWDLLAAKILLFENSGFHSILKSENTMICSGCFFVSGLRISYSITKRSETNFKRGVHVPTLKIYFLISFGQSCKTFKPP